LHPCKDVNDYTNHDSVRVASSRDCVTGWWPLKRLCVWLSDRENLVFAVLIVLHLIPIWGFTYFPSQDGPAHLSNANIILEYYRPERTILRQYYRFNENLEPMWFGHLVLAGLLSMVPLLLAEKIFLSGYVILFPVAVRYALKAIRPESGLLAVLAFPFIYNLFFHAGFYSFVYSLALFFFAIGYWLKHREHFTLRKMITLSILTLLLYGLHPISLVTAWLAIGSLAIWLTSHDLVDQVRRRQFDRSILWKVLCSRALVPFCALLPTLMLMVTFLVLHGMPASSAPFTANVWNRLLRLIFLESLISYSKSELWFLTVLPWYMFCSLGLKLFRQQLNRWDGLLLVVAVYVFIYLTTPDGIIRGEQIYQGYISHRMNLYTFLALILWFGAQPYERRLRQGIQLLAIGIAVILLELHTTKYAELNDYLTEYLSGINFIEPNTTLLPLSFSQRGHAPDGQILSCRVSPFLHASGYIAAEKGVVDLANYEADIGHFPILFRPELNPYTHIGQKGGIELEPPSVDFLTYPRRTGGRVDYILVWGIRDEQRDQKDAKAIFQQLEAAYELIYTSPQRGFVQLYRRNDWGKE
jgi:hypothetical protein